jgi:hypothetical protein
MTHLGHVVKHLAGQHDQSTHNPYKGGGAVVAAAFPLHGETIQLAKAGMVPPEELPPPREGHIRLYHTTARSEHLATIEVEGVATEYASGYEAPTDLIWATGGPNDYSEARGLVAFDVPVDRAEKVNVTDYVIRGDVPAENVVATYPMVSWGRGEAKRWDHVIDTTRKFGTARVSEAVYPDVKPLIQRVKHLPGRHDQSTHGRRSGGRVNSFADGVPGTYVGYRAATPENLREAKHTGAVFVAEDWVVADLYTAGVEDSKVYKVEVDVKKPFVVRGNEAALESVTGIAAWSLEYSGLKVVRPELRRYMLDNGYDAIITHGEGYFKAAGYTRDRMALIALDPANMRVITEKHLPGRHDQRSHGYRYGAGVTMSHLRRQRSTMTTEQWEDYKGRARARRAQLTGKPVMEAMLQKSAWGGWGEYREETDDHFLLMVTQSPDSAKHTIRPDQFDPEKERELALDTLDETRRVLREYPDLVKRMDEDGAIMVAREGQKMGMNVVFTVDDEYSGAGSGGPGSAKIFWTPYTVQGVERYQSDYYGRSVMVDPMFVAGHELHHGHSSNTELDTYSTAMGLHMHYRHGNQYILKAVDYETENLIMHSTWRAQGKSKDTSSDSRADVKFLYAEHPDDMDRVIDGYYGVDRGNKLRKRIKSW